MNCEHFNTRQSESIRFTNLREYLMYLINYLDKIEVSFSSDQRENLLSLASVRAHMSESQLAIFNDYERLELLIDGLYEFIDEDEYRDHIIACVNASYMAVNEQQDVTNKCYQSIHDLLVSAAA